jgi:hypothetical protein
MNMMYVCRLFLIVNLVSQIYGLTPSSFPSGKPKTYTVDLSDRASDLTLLDKKHTRVIAKHWENNIMNGGVEIRKEDKHIIARIDELYEIIDTIDRGDDSIMYMSWTPRGALREVLFLVVIKIDVEQEKFVVQLVLQSPFWEPQQIESRHLKYALEDLANKIDGVTLDFSQLYARDSRITLSWLTWNNVKDI